MPTTITQDIRGALQKQAANAAGFPTTVVRQGLGEVMPANSESHARLFYIPASTRPFNVRSKRFEHVGLFQISLYGPGGGGTGAIEQLADNVRAVFKPGETRLAAGPDTVTIDFSERADAMEVENDWLMVPTTVMWRCFSARN